MNPDDPNDRDEKISVQEGEFTIEYIVAGPDLDCDTDKNTNANVPWDINDVVLNINSAWRNPERNEKVGGVVNSLHQVGDANDMQVLPGDRGLFTKEMCDCMLLTAAKYAGYTNAFAEANSDRTPNCATPFNKDGTPVPVTHIHVPKE